jgi:hypothetical protein
MSLDIAAGSAATTASAGYAASVVQATRVLAPAVPSRPLREESNSATGSEANMEAPAEGTHNCQGLEICAAAMVQDTSALLELLIPVRRRCSSSSFIPSRNGTRNSLRAPCFGTGTAVLVRPNTQSNLLDLGMGKPSRRRAKRERGAPAQSDVLKAAGAAGRLHTVSSRATNLEISVVSLSLRA